MQALRGDIVKTWTGNDAPLTSGEPNILDLVVHLGRERRWGGFGSQEWTVLHHSFLCALIWLKAGFDIAGLANVLLHDGHEAYTGDIPSPMKALLGREITVLEDGLDSRIRSSLGVHALHPGGDLARRLKVCDLAALVIEAPFFGPPGSAGPCEHSAGLAGVPAEYRQEVEEVLYRALPDFAQVQYYRGKVLR